jgi:hypothetical protein
MSDENFLSRWSRRKSEAKAPEPAPSEPIVPAADATPADADAAAKPLPPLESLTPESDFTPFMKQDVDAGTRREALKTLFRDPRYNVMDGLDVYIDDYSKPDPIPEGWLDRMYQTTRLGEFLDPDREKVGDEARQAAAESANPDAAPAEAETEPLELSKSCDKSEWDQASAGDSPDDLAAKTEARIPPPEI